MLAILVIFGLRPLGCRIAALVHDKIALTRASREARFT
jgi:hypothetical protein